MGNTLRTAFLLTVMTVLIMLVGQLIGGSHGMFIALIFAAGMNFFSYWFSDKVVLKMYRAQEVTAQQAPELYNMVANLARNGNLPTPRVYIIPQQTPNAFATGRNPQHAVVAVTQGLLELMSHDEIKGVLAHEMAHVKNRDILIGSIAATMAGAIMMLASMARWSAIFGGGHRSENNGGMGGLGLIVMSIIAPMAAVVVQMAISRSREYQADAVGASLAGDSGGLANALEKLGAYSKQLPMTANPSTAHMFIVNPLTGRSLTSLFSTHPAIEDRIARLRGVRTAQTSQATQTPPPPPGTEKSGGKQDAMARGRAFWDNID